MKKKILVISNTIDPLYGGPTFSGANSTVSLADIGYEVKFVAPATEAAARRGGEVVNGLMRRGVSVSIFPILWPSVGVCRRTFFSFGLLIWLVLKARQYDLVIIRSPWAAASFFQSSLRWLHLSPPLLIVPHESFTDFDFYRTGAFAKRLIKRTLGQYLIRSASGVVFSSPLEKETSAKVFSFGATDIIFHPVEVADSPPERGTDRFFTVGYFGRLHKKKNVNLLLEALALTPDCRLLVGGAGEEEATLRQLAGMLNVADRVEWLGLVPPSRKGWFFSQCDIVAMPSDFECFGMTIAEAISSEVPVVTTRFTGLSQLIEKEGCGFVVEKDASSISVALHQYVSNKTIIDKQKVACRMARQHFTIEGHGNSFDAIIRKTLGEVIA